jgi:hypothetical protein
VKFSINKIEKKMQPFRTVLMGFLWLGLAIANNCDIPGHDHTSEASQQSYISSGFIPNGLQGFETVSNIGSGVPLTSVTYRINPNENIGSVAYSGGSEYISPDQEFYSLGNINSVSKQDNVPYWWMNNPSIFQAGVSPLCGPNTNCNAGTTIKVKEVEHKMDLSKNPFINGNFAAEVSKHPEISSSSSILSSKIGAETIGNRINTNAQDKEINLSFNPFLGGAIAPKPIHSLSLTHGSTGQNTDTLSGNKLTNLNIQQHNGFGTVNTHGRKHSANLQNSQSFLSTLNDQAALQALLNGLAQQHEQFGTIDSYNHRFHQQQNDDNLYQLEQLAYRPQYTQSTNLLNQNTLFSRNDLLNGQNTRLNTNTFNTNLGYGNSNSNKVEGYKTANRFASTNQNTEFLVNPFLNRGQSQYSDSASLISGSASTLNNNPLFNGIPQPTEGSELLSGLISTTNDESRFGGYPSNSNYGNVNVDRGYLPPVPATVTCTGPNKVCAPSALCRSGVITDISASSNRLTNQKQYCDVDEEVCCRVLISPPPTTPRPVCLGSNLLCAPRSLCGSGTISDLVVAANGLSNQVIIPF